MTSAYLFDTTDLFEEKNINLVCWFIIMSCEFSQKILILILDHLTHSLTREARSEDAQLHRAQDGRRRYVEDA